MFSQIKKNEKVETKAVFQQLKKKEDTKIEIVKDKIGIFNELDTIFRNK